MGEDQQMTSKHIFVDGTECKVCARCGHLKPLSEYYRNKNCKDSLHLYCKDCVRTMNARSIDKNHAGDHQVGLWIGEDEYQVIRDEAVKVGMKPAALMEAIVYEWLEQFEEELKE